MKKRLRNKEVRKLLNEITILYGQLKLSQKDRFEIDDNLILINSKPFFFYYESKLAPTLKLILEKNFLKKITVDMGAVKFVVNGADIMRPGVTKADENIQQGEIISIIDETYSKPLAIGLALFDEKEILNKTSGRVIQNLHHVGDSIWNYH